MNDLGVQDPPLFCLLPVLNITRKTKINEVDIYMFKYKNKNTRTRCEICPNSAIKAPKRR